MAKCLIIIDDLEGGFVSIKGESTPEIKEGDKMTLAQQITVDLMRSFRKHFEGDDPSAGDEGLN